MKKAYLQAVFFLFLYFLFTKPIPHIYGVGSKRAIFHYKAYALS